MLLSALRTQQPCVSITTATYVLRAFQTLECSNMEPIEEWRRAFVRLCVSVLPWGGCILIRLSLVFPVTILPPILPTHLSHRPYVARRLPLAFSPSLSYTCHCAVSHTRVVAVQYVGCCAVSLTHTHRRLLCST